MLSTLHSKSVKALWLKAIETNSEGREEKEGRGRGEKSSKQDHKTKGSPPKNPGSFMDLGRKN